jgi:hypothetical protein
MIKKADELICLNSTKASQIDEIWEPPVEEDNTSWDSTDDDDNYDSSDNTDDENENLEEED